MSSTSYDDGYSSGDSYDGYSSSESYDVSSDGSSESSSSIAEGLENYKLAQEQLCPSCIYIFYILSVASNPWAHIFSFIVASGMMKFSQRLACCFATGITSRDGELRWSEDVAWATLRQKTQQDTTWNILE